MNEIARILASTAFPGAALLAAAWAAGQILRDRTLATALLLYIPSPVVGAALLASAAILGISGRRRRAIAAVAMALAPAAFVAAVENRWTRPPAEPHAGKVLRLVHWNVWWGILGRERILQELRRERADIYIVSEPPPLPAEAIAAALGEGYAGAILQDGELAVFARGELCEERRIDGGGGRIFVLLAWRCEGATLSILAADIEAHVHRPRDPILQELRRLIAELRPDIAVGDLNAPRRSRALSPLPEGFAHAYEVAGAGWSYTWPVPIPVLAIDQCIIGPRIAPIRYALRMGLASDHRRQVLDFALRPRS